jgi:GntR family transcriptional regulator
MTTPGAAANMPRAKRPDGEAQAYAAIGLGPAYRDMAAPLYEQVYTALRDAIYRGSLAEGATIPSEVELVRMMGVSRITVRRAIDELAARGLVVRAQGRSTRVRRNIGAEPITADVEGLLENSLAMGFRTKAEVVEFNYVPAEPDVAAALEVPRGAEIQMSVRVRRLDTQPFSHLTTFLPPEIGKHIKPQELNEQPILVLLERMGVHVTHADQTISAQSASLSVAALLRVEAGTALLKIERRVIGDSGRPVEFIRALYRPDLYRYQIRLQRVHKSKTRLWRPMNQPSR